MTLRPVDPDDFDLVCRHREAMFRDMGYDPTEMIEPFRAWLAPRIADGRYFGFVAEEDGVPVAGCGLMELDWPPHFRHPSEARRGYVLNVYVEPSHRRRGVARRLMKRAEAEFRTRGVTYSVLHAADAARPLYEGMGWSPTAEMAKALPPTQAK